MKKLYFLLAYALFVLLCFANQAQAQKKPKLKGLAKEITGKWILDDVEVKIDETKATEEQKTQITNAMPKIRAELLKNKGTDKAGYFIFKPDGTYATLPPENEKEDTGTWKIMQDQITLIPDTKDGKDEFTGKIVNKGLYLTTRSSDLLIGMTLILKRE